MGWKYITSKVVIFSVKRLKGPKLFFRCPLLYRVSANIQVSAVCRCPFCGVRCVKVSVVWRCPLCGDVRSFHGM